MIAPAGWASERRIAVRCCAPSQVQLLTLTTSKTEERHYGYDEGRGEGASGNYIRPTPPLEFRAANAHAFSIESYGALELDSRAFFCAVSAFQVFSESEFTLSVAITGWNKGAVTSSCSEDTMSTGERRKQKGNVERRQKFLNQLLSAFDRRLAHPLSRAQIWSPLHDSRLSIAKNGQTLIHAHSRQYEIYLLQAIADAGQHKNEKTKTEHTESLWVGCCFLAKQMPGGIEWRELSCCLGRSGEESGRSRCREHCEEHELAKSRERKSQRSITYDRIRRVLV